MRAKTKSSSKKAMSWEQKLAQDKEHKVKHLDKKFVDIPENSEMLVATPQIFETYIRKIPYGDSTTIQKVRKDLAKKFKADHTCPVTTGLFLRIVAEANYEKWKSGTPIEEITPFWRVIDPSSSIAKKLSFGIDFLIEQRTKEGLQTPNS